MTLISLRVYGEPVPQGNKTAFAIKGTGRAVMREGRSKEANDRFKNWRAAVSSEARAWQKEQGGVPPVDAPVAVTITFWLTRPGSLPKWRWLPRSRPDLDKLARAVLDGITGTLVTDDGRVVDLVVRKRYAMGVAPGCLVEVEAIDERDENLRQAVMGVAA